MCSFPGLGVIKDIKKSRMKTNPAKGQGPFARNWWWKCSPQHITQKKKLATYLLYLSYLNRIYYQIILMFMDLSIQKKK